MMSTHNLTTWSFDAAQVHKASSVAEVVALVTKARRRNVALYPFSTGLNWGYGSRSPTAAGCELLDLRGMNRILNADVLGPAHPVAVIEPGVTQGQLHDFLAAHHPKLGFNVTGSGRDTSIIGNALERGSGYGGPRTEDIFGLEIVTGTGEVIHTGFRRLGDDSPLAHCHPYGLGPMLDGLCSQSSFGVVTSACLKLTNRRPVEAAVSVSMLEQVELGTLIDAVSQLKREGLLIGVMHLANKARTALTLQCGVETYLRDIRRVEPAQLAAETQKAIDCVASRAWSGLGTVHGNRAQVQGAMVEIRQRLKGLARVTMVDQFKLDTAFAICDFLANMAPMRARAAALAAIRPLHAMALGHPSDVAVDGLLARFGPPGLKASELDESNCGLIYVNPALPMDGRFIAATVAAMQGVAAAHGHELYVTVNLETSTSNVGVMNILFDRSQPAEVDRARRCADALLRCVHERGLEVYRARADMMGVVTGRNPEHWRWVSELKRVFDPDNIISPGRYCPLPADQL